MSRLRKLAAQAEEYRTGPTWFEPTEEGMAALRRRVDVLQISDALLRAKAPDLAILLADAEDALAGKLQHPDHVSDEVRKEENRAILDLLARIEKVCV